MQTAKWLPLADEPYGVRVTQLEVRWSPGAFQLHAASSSPLCRIQTYRAAARPNTTFACDRAAGHEWHARCSALPAQAVFGVDMEAYRYLTESSLDIGYRCRAKTS